MARELGAEYVVNAAEQDPAAEIQKLGGADAAIALAVTPRPFEQAFDSLARGGTLVMVALPPDNYVKLPIFGRTRVLRETRPLEEINDAFDDVLHARNKHPRVVLTV